MSTLLGSLIIVWVVFVCLFFVMCVIAKRGWRPFGTRFGVVFDWFEFQMHPSGRVFCKGARYKCRMCDKRMEDVLSVKGICNKFSCYREWRYMEGRSSELLHLTGLWGSASVKTEE